MTRLFTVTAVTTISLAMLGCGGPAPTTNTANTTATNANNPLETTKKAPEEAKNNAPTMTPVVKAYCDAWAKNDEGALRKVYSAAAIRQFEAEMKEEKTKSLLKLLAPDKITGKQCDVLNEQITGDRAVVRLKAEKYPDGIQLVFVKETGEWKLTTEIPDVDAVKKAQPIANTGPPK